MPAIGQESHQGASAAKHTRRIPAPRTIPAVTATFMFLRLRLKGKLFRDYLFYCFLDSNSHESQKSTPNYIDNYAAY